MMERIGCLGWIVIILCLYFGGAYYFSLSDKAWAKKSRTKLQNAGYVVYDSNTHSGITHWLSRPWAIKNPEVKAYYSVNPKAMRLDNSLGSSNVYLFDLLDDFDQYRYEDSRPSFTCGILYVQCNNSGEVKLSSFLDDCDELENIDSNGFLETLNDMKKEMKPIEDSYWYEVKAFKAICDKINCCVQ